MSFDTDLWQLDRETAEKYGVVYTPPEVVGFMLQSVLDVLRAEFPGETPHYYEPFGGGGAIVSALVAAGAGEKITVFEIMPEAVENMKNMGFPGNVEVIEADTFKNKLNLEELNVIITNPPYG